jgi:hypothetical protein
MTNNNLTAVNDAISRINPDQQAELRVMVNARIDRIKNDLPYWGDLAIRPYLGKGESVEARRAREFKTELDLLNILEIPKRRSVVDVTERSKLQEKDEQNY